MVCQVWLAFLSLYFLVFSPESKERGTFAWACSTRGGYLKRKVSCHVRSTIELFPFTGKECLWSEASSTLKYDVKTETRERGTGKIAASSNLNLSWVESRMSLLKEGVSVCLLPDRQKLEWWCRHPACVRVLKAWSSSVWEWWRFWNGERVREMDGARRTVDESQAGPWRPLYQAMEIGLKMRSDKIEYFMLF